MSRGQLRNSEHPERWPRERSEVVQGFGPARISGPSPACRSTASALRASASLAVAKRRRKGLHYVVLLLLATVPLSAQWLGVPTPGVPRTADGKPDLAAPAPKAADGHPDISGVWMPNTRGLQDLAVGMTPPD